MIKFGWLPGHWGLKGLTREIAKAEYELEGEELEITLANLKLAGKELDISLNDISFKYNHITEEEYQRANVRLTLTGKEQDRKLAEIDHKFRRISDTEYEKQLAIINNESWVKILSVKTDDESPSHGELELDWNEAFVEELRGAGYNAPSDEAVVDMWVNELCKNIAIAEFSGTGDFDEQVDVSGTHINKQKLDNGKWQVS